MLKKSLDTELIVIFELLSMTHKFMCNHIESVRMQASLGHTTIISPFILMPSK